MKTSCSALRIVVLGYIIRGPLGGLVWHYLQYVLGLQQLGHDVVFIEDSGDYPSCYDPTRHVVDTDPAYGLKFAGEVLAHFGLEDKWAYYDAHQQTWLGPHADQAIATCKSADVVMNISGVNPIRSWFEDIPVRVLVDTDPVFTQVRHLTEPDARQEAAKHTTFFTFAENFGDVDCDVPADGFRWQPTRQPLFPDAWPLSPAPSDGYFTTVMQWDSYRAVKFRSQRYGMKSESFESYQDLPAQVGSILELAIGTKDAPRKELRGKGWRIEDPLTITRTAWSYQEYIRRSLGEFSIAKHGYVVSNSGWFSERSVGYLSSGRPVVTQDTGFSRWLPTGDGLLCFSSPEEAAAALQTVQNDYLYHCQVAREVALEFFHFSKVLPAMLEQAMNAVPIPVRNDDVRTSDAN